METPSISQIQPQDGSDRSKYVTDIITRENSVLTCSEDDRFNESLSTLVNGQEDLLRHLLNVIQDMNYRHEYDNLMGDIAMFGGKTWT